MHDILYVRERDAQKEFDSVVAMSEPDTADFVTYYSQEFMDIEHLIHDSAAKAIFEQSKTITELEEKLRTSEYVVSELREFVSWSFKIRDEMAVLKDLLADVMETAIAFQDEVPNDFITIFVEYTQ